MGSWLMAFCSSFKHTVGLFSPGSAPRFREPDCVETAVPQFSASASCCGGMGGPWAGWGLGSKRVGHLTRGCGLQPRNTSHPQRYSWKQNSRERPILASHQDMLAECHIRATLGELRDPRSQRMLRT